jgi:hypothetical protein
MIIGIIGLLLSIGMSKAEKKVEAQLQIELGKREAVLSIFNAILKRTGKIVNEKGKGGGLEILEELGSIEKEIKEFYSQYGAKLNNLNRNIRRLLGGEIFCALFKWLFSGIGISSLAGALYMRSLRKRPERANQINLTTTENENPVAGKLVSTSLRWFDWGIILLVSLFFWMLDPVWFFFAGELVGDVWHFVFWLVLVFIVVKVIYGTTLKKVWNITFPALYEWTCSKCESTVTYGEARCPRCEIEFKYKDDRAIQDSGEGVSEQAIEKINPALDNKSALRRRTERIKKLSARLGVVFVVVLASWLWLNFIGFLNGAPIETHRLYSYGLIGQSKTVQILIATLKSPSGNAQAAAALGKIGPDAMEAIPILVTTLANPNGDVRKAAEDGLAKINPDWAKLEATKGAVPALVVTLRDPDSYKRQLAAEVIGRIGFNAREAILSLVLALDDTPNVQQAVELALGKIGPATKDAVPRLVELLKHPTVSVREWSAWALGQIGSNARDAIPALSATLKDEIPRVREAAAQALSDIQGK